MPAKAKTPDVNLDNGQVTNDANDIISFETPYIAEVQVTGTVPLLLHAYSVDAVKEKNGAAKGSLAKKTDDVESYAYRVSDTDRRIGIPGLNLRAAIVEAGRYKQDPRSARKSMMDLLRAGVMPITNIAPFEPDITTWDYEDTRRARVQQNAIPRTRPAMRSGWKATFQLQVTVPQLIEPKTLHALIVNAGRLVGLCDYRPTFGQFQVTRFEVLQLE